MNKAELVNAVAKASGERAATVDQVLSAAFDVIAGAVSGGERVQLKGFGAFELAERASRIGRNPQTGEAVQIPAKKVAKAKLTFLNK